MEGQIEDNQQNNINPSLWIKTCRFVWVSDQFRFTQLIQGQSWGLKLVSLTPEPVLLTTGLYHLSAEDPEFKY